MRAKSHIGQVNSCVDGRLGNYKAGIPKALY